jgi:hypothetical protein
MANLSAVPLRKVRFFCVAVELEKIRIVIKG